MTTRADSDDDGASRTAGPERDRVAELFARASGLGADERRSLLAAECAGDPGPRTEVESLLAAADAAGGFLDGGLDGDRAAALIHDDDGARIPERAGPYRLLREIGRGGMGSVYLAERADDEYRKQVAIKFVRGGWESADTLRRFRIERQVLASLEHPNIARLLDGGTTDDGVPYVVMEYVDGAPIDRYCEERGLGADERIALFLAVCKAVAYAHQNLVVHRDLKPSNVLVAADGTPKLLDFGIAKLLGPGDETTVTREARPMTPAYASPEQVRGEAINTSSDVYSLGALLYQLLAGRPPFRLSGRSSAEVQRIVSEEAPAPPGTGDRDLDTIVLAALRKEPAARYATVGELAEDLRRYLAGLPVSARRATLAYRAGKYLRRHRFGVAAALAGVVLLAATAGFYTWRLAAERDLARAEAVKARKVTELLVGLFRGSSPRTSGVAEVTAREILDTGAHRLSAELRDQPEIHAELLTTLARVYLELDLLDQATSQAEQAVDLRRGLFGDDGAETADSREVLAQVWIAKADYDAARELLDRVREVRAARFGTESVEYARALHSQALLELRASNDAEARGLLEELLALRQRLLGPDDPDVAKTLSFLGVAARRLDEPEQAEQFYRRSIAIYERSLGPDHPDLASTLNNLAVVLSRTGRLEEARATYERALAIHERAWGPEHDLVAGTLDNLGETLKNLGRPEEALPLVQRALAYREKHLGPNHHATGTTLNTLANIYRELGRYDEAVPLYERSIAATEASLGKEHFWVAWPVSNLAKLYLMKGEPERARPLYERSLELRRNALGEQHTQVAFSLEDLAGLEQAEGDLPAAIALLRRAVEIRRALPDSPRSQLAASLRSLAAALTASGDGDGDEAAALEREADQLGEDEA